MGPFNPPKSPNLTSPWDSAAEFQLNFSVVDLVGNKVWLMDFCYAFFQRWKSKNKVSSYISSKQLVAQNLLSNYGLNNPY